MPATLPPGGILRLQFDWYITVRLFSTRSDHSTPNHLSGHKLCLFLLRLKYYKQREMSKKIITNFKKMIFSLLPFHAGSPFSLFFKVVSPVFLIFSGRFSLLPKPFLSPLAMHGALQSASHCARSTRTYPAHLFRVARYKRTYVYAHMRPNTTFVPKNKRANWSKSSQFQLTLSDFKASSLREKTFLCDMFSAWMSQS